jgi:hypothetical protein
MVLMSVVMFVAWPYYPWYLLGRRFGGPFSWSGWYGKEKIVMLGIRFRYHSCSPCSLIAVLTGLSMLLVKIETWYNNHRTVFIGRLCNVKFLDCLVVNQSYMHYSVKYMLPMVIAVGISFCHSCDKLPDLTFSLSRGHPVVFEYNIKIK